MGPSRKARAMSLMDLLFWNQIRFRTRIDFGYVFSDRVVFTKELGSRHASVARAEQ
jgi:hypothetical protein